MKKNSEQILTIDLSNCFLTYFKHRKKKFKINFKYYSSESLQKLDSLRNTSNTKLEDVV